MAEPVTLTEAKAQCAMADDNTQDTFITSLIAPARAYVEKRTGYSFVEGERILTFGRWGDYLEIYLRPIDSVDTVAYTDEAGTEAEYTGFLAPNHFPLRIYPGVDDSFPGLAEGGAITVTVTTGVLDAASQEYLIGKRAMLLLIGHWFDNREAAVVGESSAAVEFALQSLVTELAPISAY